MKIPKADPKKTPQLSLTGLLRGPCF